MSQLPAIPDNAHPLLACALRAAGDQAPPGPFHLDGPVVTIPVRYGILTKQGRRYRWIVGSRDDVLATVPDHHMEAAVQAVLARDEHDATQNMSPS
jgi:hypothetical protein